MSLFLKIIFFNSTFEINMYKNIFLISGLLLLLTVSCDSKKGEAEKIAKEFALAVNDKDLSAVNSLYPLVSKMKVSHLVDSLDYKKIKVNFLDSIYVAEYEPGGQFLYINVKDNKKAEIINSRSIVKLDPSVFQLAQLTGVPVKKIDDYQLDLLFQPSKYTLYLTEQTYNKNGESLVVNYKDIHWVAGNNIEGLRNNVKISAKLTNQLNHEIKGDEYNLEINVAYGSGLNNSKLYVEPGVNLMPNESHVFVVTDQNLYKYFHNYNVAISAQVLPKNQSIAGVLVFMGDFNGNEYNDFLKQNPGVNIDNPATYISVNEVNEEAAKTAGQHVNEIKDFIKEFYRKYVFGTQDLSSDKSYYEKHLSPGLISTLRKEYEEETGENDGFGVWIFRSFDNDNIGSHDITISYEGDGVFKVNVQDGQTKVTKYITAKYTDGNVVLEKII